MSLVPIHTQVCAKLCAWAMLQKCNTKKAQTCINFIFGKGIGPLNKMPCSAKESLSFWKPENKHENSGRMTLISLMINQYSPCLDGLVFFGTFCILFRIFPLWAPGCLSANSALVNEKLDLGTRMYLDFPLSYEFFEKTVGPMYGQLVGSGNSLLIKFNLQQTENKSRDWNRVNLNSSMHYITTKSFPLKDIMNLSHPFKISLLEVELNHVVDTLLNVLDCHKWVKYELHKNLQYVQCFATLPHPTSLIIVKINNETTWTAKAPPMSSQQQALTAVCWKFSIFVKCQLTKTCQRS